MAPPFKSAEFDVLYGEGISREGSILDMGLECDLIRKSGSWFTLANGDQLGQGREKCRLYLKENPQICDDLERQIRVAYGLISEPEAEDADSPKQDGDAASATKANAATAGTASKGQAAGAAAAKPAGADSAAKAAEA